MKKEAGHWLITEIREPNKVSAFKELAFWRVEMHSKLTSTTPHGEKAM